MSNTLAMSTDNLELIKGIRVRNCSVKIFKRSDGQFMVQLKTYLWRFRLTQKFMLAKNYEEAEDYLISARFDGKIN